MEFTQPQVKEGQWWRVTGSDGTRILPFVDRNTNLPYAGVVDAATLFTAFGARMADSDYNKGTPWKTFDTLGEARASLALDFNLCPKCLNAFYAPGKCSGDHA